MLVASTETLKHTCLGRGAVQRLLGLELLLWLRLGLVNLNWHAYRLPIRRPLRVAVG